MVATLMNRRYFLKGLLLVPVAPAIVKAENIMRVVPLARWSRPIFEMIDHSYRYGDLLMAMDGIYTVTRSGLKKVSGQITWNYPPYPAETFNA